MVNLIQMHGLKYTMHLYKNIRSMQSRQKEVDVQDAKDKDKDKEKQDKEIKLEIVF